MDRLTRLLAAALLAAGALAASSAPAFAAHILWNYWGQCWRVHGHYPYYQGWGGTYRLYQWRGQEEGEDDNNWGEHEGRGHWHGGEGEED
jgi:hypothetical protein